MATTESVLKPDFGSSKRHFIFTDEHERLRESIHAFVTKELAPHAEEWEETTFPDSVFRRMGELGFLGLSYPEEYGGQGGDYFCNLVLGEELTYANSGGLAMGIAVHTDMATPPVHLFGTEEQKQQYLVPSIKGEKISSLGITEPDAGSDVAGIKTRAVRDGDEYVINGSKTYITNGCEGFCFQVYAKVEGRVTAFVVDRTCPGFTTSNHIDKLGMRGSNTSELVFEGCEVPAANLLGNRNIMDTPFNQTSYTAKTIQDQQARKLDDVLAKLIELLQNEQTRTWVAQSLSLVAFSKNFWRILA